LDPDYAASWNDAGMATHATRLDRVLAAGRCSDAELAALDLGDVRRRRSEANREETDLSYLRRVLHGRIDIIAAEQARRAAGGQGRLVDRLSAILRDEPPASARSARHMDVDPGAEPGEYRAHVETLLAAPEMTAVLDRPDADLGAALDTLRGYEREVSGYRNRVQTVVDRFGTELTRRYKDGHATVDELLHGEQTAD
jgi:hypothetical protein